MTTPQTKATAANERFSACSETQNGSFTSIAENQVKPASSTSLTVPAISQVEDSMMQSQLYSEDALRATTAGAALSKAGQILRGTGNQYMDGNVIDHYKKSFKVNVIDYFWSHSWRANAVHKVCTLLFFHNGSKALAAGMIAALLGSIAAWPNRWVYDTAFTTLVFAMIFGEVAFWVTLLFWRSDTSVFLDKICIHQTDAKLKEAGIKSLGGFLRHSRQMLILFDDTYLSRLWCVFEVATLLNIRSGETSIVIEPVRSGAITIVLTAAANFTRLFAQYGPRMALYSVWNDSFYLPSTFISFIMFVCPMLYVIPTWRRFVRETSNAKKQISEFSFDSSRCFCCDNNHIFPGTDVPIPCDRNEVRQCIHAWFGTTGDFDNFTRNSLAHQFSMAGMLSYKQAFTISIGRVYFFIGAVSFLHSDHFGLKGYSEKRSPWQRTWYELCYVFSSPIAINLMGRIVWLVNKAPLQGWKGWVVNCVCVFLAFIIYVIETAVPRDLLGPGAPVSEYVVYFSILIVTSVLIFPDIRKPFRRALRWTKEKPQMPNASDQQPKPESEPKKGAEGNHVNSEAELELDAQLPTGGKIDLFV